MPDLLEQLDSSFRKVSLRKYQFPPRLIGRVKQTDIWIKDDGTLSYPYGGTKIRKLEILFGDAKNKQAKRFLSFGGIGSNYLVAVAAHAPKAELIPHGIVVDQPLTTHVRENLLLMHHFGLNVHYPDDSKAQKYVPHFMRDAVPFTRSLWLYQKLSRQLRKEDHVKPYGCRPGGSTVLGSLGCAIGAVELCNEIEGGLMPKPDAIFVTVGSVGTFAGLIAGLGMCGMDVPVVGVQVVEKYIVNKWHVRHLAKSIVRLVEKQLNWKFSTPWPRWRIETGYFGNVYGQPTKAAMAAVESAKDMGIKMESTYTGKTFAALLDDAKDFNSERNVVFWNTYNQFDKTPILEKMDWKTLPEKFHKFFDGTVPLAEPV